MKSLIQLIEECFTLNESLDVEKQTYESPEEDFYINIDEEDPNNGTITYLGYEFPISKTLKAGGVEYFIGNVAQGKLIRGDRNSAFLKVKDAIINGLVNPSTNTSSVLSKVQRDLPDTVTIDTKHGPKTYKYIPSGEVDNFVTSMYNKYGPENYTEALKGYATDRPNGNINDPYIPINQTVRQNVFTHKLGTKAKAVNYRTR